MMTDRTSAARPPATTIEVRVPDGRDTSIGGNPIHVDADVLYDAIDLLQVLVLTLDPLKGEDDTDLGAVYRLRLATRRITTRLEAAVLADWDTDDGEPCHAYIAELVGAPATTSAQDALDAGVYDRLTPGTAGRGAS